MEWMQIDDKLVAIMEKDEAFALFWSYERVSYDDIAHFYEKYRMTMPYDPMYWAKLHNVIRPFGVPDSYIIESNKWYSSASRPKER